VSGRLNLVMNAVVRSAMEDIFESFRKFEKV